MAIKRFSLHFGINKYKSSPLYGCVADADHWFNLVAYRLGSDNSESFLNSACTTEFMLDKMEEVVRRAKRSDKVIITNSSHGSYVPDYDGDEPDGVDEIICPIDIHLGKWITDDQIYAILSKRVQGAQVFFISDSCHSGSVHRMMPPLNVTQAVNDAPEQVRFLPPTTFFDAPRNRPVMSRDLDINILGLRNQERAARAKTSGVLFSGCADTEYSYDAYIENKSQGAFSYAAIKTFNEKQTLKQWHQAIRKVLPSRDYPQTPQFQATAAQLKWKL